MIRGLTRVAPLDPACGVYEFTPEACEVLLETPGAKNRPLRVQTVMRYARRMDRGLWALSGEPIILNEKWEPLDGEHRLRACIESRKSFTSVLLIGPFQFKSMGQGQSRSGGDAIALGLPEQANVIAMSAIAGLCIKHERALRREGSMYTNAHGATEAWTDIDNAERVTWVKKNARAGELYVTAKTLSGRGKALIPLSPLAAAWYLAEQASDVSTAAAWFEGLVTGAGLTRDDVRLHIRKAMASRAQANNKPTSVEALHWLAKGWSLRAVTGRTLFAVKRTEAFPFIRAQAKPAA